MEVCAAVEADPADLAARQAYALALFAVGQNAEAMEQLLESIRTERGAYADAHDVELPYLEEVNAWGSSRYNGYDVPLGVVCFVFDENSCFEKAISQSGKDLKKIIGHCNVTEWTEYSC